MKKALLTALCLVGAFFVCGVQTAKASTQYARDATPINGRAFGSSSSNISKGFQYVATSTYSLKHAIVKISQRDGAPTTHVVAELRNSSCAVVATSTNEYLGTDLPASAIDPATTEFFFDSFAVASGTTYYFNLRVREGTYDGSNNYAWSTTAQAPPNTLEGDNSGACSSIDVTSSPWIQITDNPLPDSVTLDYPIDGSTLGDFPNWLVTSYSEAYPSRTVKVLYKSTTSSVTFKDEYITTWTDEVSLVPKFKQLFPGDWNAAAYIYTNGGTYLEKSATSTFTIGQPGGEATLPTPECPDFGGLGFANDICEFFVWLFIPDLGALNQNLTDTKTIFASRFPFSYISSFQTQWTTAQDTSSNSETQLAVNFSSLTSSTSAFGNFMPSNITFLSASSVRTYASDGTWNLLRTLMALAIYFGTFEMIYFGAVKLFEPKSNV